VDDRAHASAPPLRFGAETLGQPNDVTGDACGDLDSVRRELADVVAAVGGGAEPPMSIEQPLEVQAVVDTLYRSAAEDREVEAANVWARLRSAVGDGR
jgi:predicted dehydrogenase